MNINYKKNFDLYIFLFYCSRLLQVEWGFNKTLAETQDEISTSAAIGVDHIPTECLL